MDVHDQVEVEEDDNSVHTSVMNKRKGVLVGGVVGKADGPADGAQPQSRHGKVMAAPRPK